MNLDPVTAAIVALALLASDPEFELWVKYELIIKPRIWIKYRLIHLWIRLDYWLDLSRTELDYRLDHLRIWTGLKEEPNPLTEEQRKKLQKKYGIDSD